MRWFFILLFMSTLSFANTTWKTEVSGIGVLSEYGNSVLGGGVGANGKIVGPLYLSTDLGVVLDTDGPVPIVAGSLELALLPFERLALRAIGGAGFPGYAFTGLRVQAMLTKNLGVSGRYLVNLNEKYPLSTRDGHVVHAGLVFKI